MRNIGFIVFLCLLSQVSKGAELGARFDSYEDMHLKSSYGTLFFADGSTESFKISDNHEFALISGDGEIQLPPQSGYCFLFNHYSEELGFQNELRPYYGTISKWVGDKKLKPEHVNRQIIPTANGESIDVADVCVDGLDNVSRIEIKFGMYKARPRTISFKLQ